MPRHIKNRNGNGNGHKNGNGEKSTAEWAQMAAAWYAGLTELQQSRPIRLPKELKLGYHKAKASEFLKGLVPTPLQFGDREASTELRGRVDKAGDVEVKVVFADTRSVKGATRRGSEKGKTISIEERQEWYKRNLYPDWQLRGAQDFAMDVSNRKDLKKRIAEANKTLPRGQKLIYEHLAPLASPEEMTGGFESWRNTVAAPEDLNSKKSDRIATRQVLQEQNVPLTRSGVIRADAREIPLATDTERFGAVYDSAMREGASTARAQQRYLRNTDGALRFIRNIDLPGSTADVVKMALAGTVLNTLATGNPSQAAQLTAKDMVENTPDYVPVVGDALDLVQSQTGVANRHTVKGQEVFVNQHNKVLGNEKMGVQYRNGKAELVERGKGAAGDGSTMLKLKKETAKLLSHLGSMRFGDIASRALSV